ncbi:MAG: DUF3598 family protein [Cyanobacteria bacterium J06621_8]
MLTQWDCFLKNLGEWHGSFTRFSPQGDELADTPTLVTLEGQNNNKNVHQVVRYLPPDEPFRDVVVDYDSLSRSILFFDNGAFCQGSMQWGPYSTFGAEFGLIDNQYGDGTRRLRMVELYDSSAQLEKIVLIREYLPHSNVAERPSLTIESLLGEWSGEAITLFADLSQPSTFSSHLEIKQLNKNSIQQSLSFGEQNIISKARVEGSRLIFDSNDFPTQVMLFPDGASCSCPLQIKLGHNFVLEMGWLLQENIRQRIMRSYNAKGNWVSCTLVTEKKVS